MPHDQRVLRPSDLIDWSEIHAEVYDLIPEWQRPLPNVAGLRTREDVESLRSWLMAGRPFRRDVLAPRLLTDRGQRIIDRFGIAEGAQVLGRRLRSSTWGLIFLVVGAVVLLAMVGGLGAAAVLVTLLLMVAFPVVVSVVCGAIAKETVRPVVVAVGLRPEERSVVRQVRTAVRHIQESRAYRDGYLEEHRARVDLNSTADAITRRVIELSQVRSLVGSLTGPVRTQADAALREVETSLATQVKALQSYDGHVQRLDQHLRDADSADAAGPVFDSIRGLLASTVEDDLERPRLVENSQLTGAMAASISRMTLAAAADLDLLAGIRTPSLPQLG